MRSSQVGSHQFARPSRLIVAGTRIMRTSVASRSTATASPTPNILPMGSSPRTKAPNTLIMISAAEVMTLAVLDRPSTTDVWLSPDATYSSRTRDSRNTS